MGGLALGAYKPAKVSQHEVNFSLYRPISACGLGGDREALTISFDVVRQLRVVRLSKTSVTWPWLLPD